MARSVSDELSPSFLQSRQVLMSVAAKRPAIAWRRRLASSGASATANFSSSQLL